MRDRFFKIKEMDKFIKFQNLKEETTLDQINQFRRFKSEICLKYSGEKSSICSEHPIIHSTTPFKTSSDNKLAQTTHKDNLKFLTPNPGKYIPAAQELQYSSSWVSTLQYDLCSYIPYFCSQDGKKKNEEIFIKKNK
jgi:hypothetical protein